MPFTRPECNEIWSWEDWELALLKSGMTKQLSIALQFPMITYIKSTHDEYHLHNKQYVQFHKVLSHYLSLVIY